jgi:predicted nuclease of predicted toxin-antitoxin system
LKLLLDENLSPRLVPKLLSLFASLIHVRDVGLKQADDHEIWNWARANEYTIMTADADFVALSLRLGWPPKVIQIERCDFPFSVIEELLRWSSVRISEFDKDVSSGLLVLRLQ